MNVDFYKMRIDAIRDASARSRWVFAAATIASVALIATTWSSSLSWLRSFLNVPFSKDPLTRQLQQDLMRQWVETLSINVPVLGIRFSNTDAPVLGSAALVIISVWLFYALRRENHLIGQTLYDVRNESSELKAFVFHGILGTQVFSTVSENDAPISSIEGSPHRTMPTVRRLSRALVYLPAFTIAYIILTNIAGLFFIPAAFRDGHPILIEALIGSIGSGSAVMQVQWGSLVDAFFRLSVALALAMSTWFLLYHARAYQDGNIALLREASVLNWGAVTPETSSDRRAPQPAAAPVGEVSASA